MKVKVNIRDYLADQCGGDLNLDVNTSVDVDIDDLLGHNGIDEEHEFDINIHELLAENRTIGHIWDIDDVQDARPDLDEDQSWRVLQTIDKHLDSDYGITWDTMRLTAEQLFGPKPEQRWHGRIDVTITDTDGYGRDEVLTRLRDMAELVAKDMPEVKATADEGSICLAKPSEATSQ